MGLLKEIGWLLRRKAVVVKNPRYHQDGLTTKHNCDFLKDPLFLRACATAKETGEWRGAELHWRVFVEIWAAVHGSKLEGDFVHCGVERGSTARVVIEYVDFKNLPKRFYLLDTFCGLVEDQISAEERAHGISRLVYDECYEEVTRTFAPFPNVEIIRGKIPDTLSQVPSESVAYLSIDMNCAKPEIAAAEFFWPRMSSGAVMVLDDYGWKMCIEQKKAFDEFADRHDVMILPLPTGQGLIVKP